MADSLVEAVREFRRRHASPDPRDTYVQKVTWDLDESSLVGERMDARGIRLLGQYVDSRLKEYSAIHNSRAEVRELDARVNIDIESDEHVCRDSENDGFQRFNTSCVPRSPNFERPNTSRSIALRPRADEPVVAVDDIEGMPARIGDEGCPTRVTQSRPQDQETREEAERCVDFARSEGVSCGLLDDDRGDDMDEDDCAEATGVTVRRFRGSALEAIRYNYYQEEQEGRPFDEIAGSNGQLPEVPMENRTRDTLLRYPPQRGQSAVIGVPRPESGRRSTAPPSVSYVTSYNVDHVKREIVGRVLTVPADAHVDDLLWFDCGGDDPGNVKEVVRRTVRANLVIRIGGRKIPERSQSDREIVAQETLREMVSEDNFRKYVKYGFVNVRGRSGDVYQVFKDRWHTKVWRRGKLVSEVCVRLRDRRIPPTDNVIALMSMIWADEQGFLKAGNVYRLEGAA